MTLTPPLFEIFSGAMSRLFLRARTPNLKFVPLAILEPLRYHLTTKHLQGHMTLATLPFTPF